MNAESALLDVFNLNKLTNRNSETTGVIYSQAWLVIESLHAAFRRCDRLKNSQ
jgi:hypothetical protein